MNMPKMAVIGGTGALGGGLAKRLARGGFDVVIGSRDAGRAAEAAARVARETGSKMVSGTDNVSAAAGADVVFVTVPFASQVMTLADIAPVVTGKIVVDTTVPLVPPKVARVQLPPQGSAAAIAAETLGSQVRLVTGFHNVSATKLGAHGETGCDVLVFGDDVEAREQVVAITNQLGVRALHGGPLANAVAAEAMTSLLIAINKRYKIEEGAGIVITGIPRQQDHSQMMDAYYVSSLAPGLIPVSSTGGDLVAVVREGLVSRIGDIVVVLQQVAPKAEGRPAGPSAVSPSDRPRGIAARTAKDPRLSEVMPKAAKHIADPADL